MSFQFRFHITSMRSSSVNPIKNFISTINHLLRATFRTLQDAILLNFPCARESFPPKHPFINSQIRMSTGILHSGQPSVSVFPSFFCFHPTFQPSIHPSIHRGIHNTTVTKQNLLSFFLFIYLSIHISTNQS